MEGKKEEKIQRAEDKRGRRWTEGYSMRREGEEKRKQRDRKTNEGKAKQRR